MTLTGMRKHVGVLEQAGLIITEKVGRARTCKLGLRRPEEEAAWIERYRQLWDARFDEVDRVVEELKQKEKVDGRRKDSERTSMKNRTTVERKVRSGGSRVDDRFSRLTSRCCCRPRPARLTCWPGPARTHTGRVPTASPIRCPSARCPRDGAGLSQRARR